MRVHERRSRPKCINVHGDPRVANVLLLGKRADISVMGGGMFRNISARSGLNIIVWNRTKCVTPVMDPIDGRMDLDVYF